MVNRGFGTMIFAGGETLSRQTTYPWFRTGRDAYSNFVRCVAKDLNPLGIHVVHVLIDGPIDHDQEDLPPDPEYIDVIEVADTYWKLHMEKRGNWTEDVTIRPKGDVHSRNI